MLSKLTGFALILLISPLGLSAAETQIPTVPNVELNSYLGQWYELLRIPNSFEDNQPRNGEGVCYNTTAEYALLPNGKVQVQNTCYRKSTVEVAHAKARIVKGSHNSKLKVNFTGLAFLEWLHIGDGDYWILGLGPVNERGQYSWALVGAPKLDYGWILSRTPELPDQEIDTILNLAASLGYDRTQFKAFRR